MLWNATRTIFLSTKRFQITSCLTLLYQSKAHFFQESSRMRWLAPSPRLLRLCSKGTNQCRIQTLRWGGPGHPDPKIRGGAVSKIFFSASRTSVWAKNKGGPPLDPPLQQLTPLRRSEIMLKLDPASCHLSMMNTSQSGFSVRYPSLYEGLKISQTPFYVWHP